MDKRNNTVNIISTIATILILAVMTVTLICQKGFNEKQIEFNERVLKLSEASGVPQVFAELDSLKELKSEEERNVFYTIKNVGNTPAFKLRSRCEVNRQKANPINNELPTGLVADIFPTQTKPFPVKRRFGFEGVEDTLYFHVRIDYEDRLKCKYCYKATYWILAKTDPVTRDRISWGIEKSEFFPLDKK